MAMVLMLNGSAHENGKCTFENDAVNEVAALLEKGEVVLSKYNDRDTSRMQ